MMYMAINKKRGFTRKKVIFSQEKKFLKATSLIYSSIPMVIGKFLFLITWEKLSAAKLQGQKFVVDKHKCEYE